MQRSRMRKSKTALKFGDVFKPVKPFKNRARIPNSTTRRKFAAVARKQGSRIPRLY